MMAASVDAISPRDALIKLENILPFYTSVIDNGLGEEVAEAFRAAKVA